MTRKKQLKNRAHLVRQWLMADMRLAKHYDAQPPAEPEQSEYWKRVIKAVKRTRVYMRNIDGAHLKFMDLVMRGDMDKLAVCDAAHISPGTYNNWLRAMIRVFGAAMGVWV